MGKALYRQYRPKKLAEVIGQEHVTTTLDHALKRGMMSHAYLLTGPRGVGKTSIARILAFEVNGIPYDEESSHLDIIEIDAASNRRIDEIRDLKERVNIAPTSAKYKVYIIDEVHMLTREAFNALLKTLEEPPAHVIFILATTEAHKVPETIISRTQRLTFKPVEQSKVISHLKVIAKNESIVIDDEALQLIASHGEGSFRDSISLLDQVRHSNSQVSLRDVQQAVGQAPEDILDGLLAAVSEHKVADVAASLDALRTQGVQPSQIAKQLSARLRQEIITEANGTLSADQALRLLPNLLQISAAPDPALSLELALYESALSGVALTQLPPVAATSSVPAIPKPSSKTKTQNPVPSHETTPSKQKDTADLLRQPVELDITSWQEVLFQLKGSHNTLYGIARMAVPRFEGDKLTLSFGFAFHQKRLLAHKKVLLDAVHAITGSNVDLECVLETATATQPSTDMAGKEAEDTIDLETISNIFGGAEIVE